MRKGKLHPISNCTSYYDLGREVGRYWGEEFFRLQKDDEYSHIVLEYLDYICGDEDDQEGYAPLLKNTMLKYPEIIEEIHGMVAGVRETRWKPGKKIDFYKMFSFCMGETGDDQCLCSSIVVPPTNKRKTWLLGHTDEDYKRAYPLLTAIIKLKTDKWSGEFLSVSHPFQLLGSSAGMNHHFAFQGNSIGYYKYWKDIEDHWDKMMIPKTVLTRKLFEANDRREVKDILAGNVSTLPSHNYIVFKNGAQSYSIRPRWEGHDYPIEPLPLKVNMVYFHTNHFKHKRYKGWEFKEPSSLQDSEKRRVLLKNLINGKNWTGASLFEAMKLFVSKNDRRVRNATSCAMVFEIGKGISNFWLKSYIDGDEIMCENAFDNCN